MNIADTNNNYECLHYDRNEIQCTVPVTANQLTAKSGKPLPPLFVFVVYNNTAD